MTACRGCDAPLPEPRTWRGGDYCGPACQDRAVERVIIDAIRAPIPRSSRPRVRRPSRRWCLWDGETLPRGSKTQFCCAECAAAYLEDVDQSQQQLSGEGGQ